MRPAPPPAAHWIFARNNRPAVPRRSRHRSRLWRLHRSRAQADFPARNRRKRCSRSRSPRFRDCRERGRAAYFARHFRSSARRFSASAKWDRRASEGPARDPSGKRKRNWIGSTAPSLAPCRSAPARRARGRLRFPLGLREKIRAAARATSIAGSHRERARAGPRSCSRSLPGAHSRTADYSDRP